MRYVLKPANRDGRVEGDWGVKLTIHAGSNPAPGSIKFTIMEFGKIESLTKSQFIRECVKLPIYVKMNVTYIRVTKVAVKKALSPFFIHGKSMKLDVVNEGSRFVIIDIYLV